MISSREGSSFQFAVTPYDKHYSLPNTDDVVIVIYEIRIIRRGMEKPEIFSSSHVSDHAAVRRAHALADNGDRIEVWRGTECVFSGER